MKVLITGANGFIGSHLVKVFYRKHQVTALVRKTSDRKFISRYPIQFLEGDLSDKNLFRKLDLDFDLVIHAAAKASDWGDYNNFFKSNVMASFNLVEAIPPKTRFMYISTNAVLGEEDCTTPKNEDSPYLPICPYFMENLLPSGMNYYRLSKTIAEQIVIRKAELRNIDLTVIRPVWVFGPREFHAGPYEYCRTVLSGIPAMPGSTKNLFHCIYVEDLAKVVLYLAENQRSGVNIYNIGNPEVPLMDEFWEAFCKELNISKPPIFPSILLYPLAIFLEIIWNIFKSNTPPLFTRARLYMFQASNVYSVKKLVDEIGFKNFTPLARAVRKTVRWWRMNKFLNF